MIQLFWTLDFIGLLIARLILGLFLFKEFLSKKNLSYFEKLTAYIYLILSIFIILGYYTSFVSILLIIVEFFFTLKDFFFEKFNPTKAEIHFLRISLAIVFIFIGPGLISLDRIYNIRF